MPYEGGKLAPWFGDAPVKAACFRMADAGGTSMTRRVRLLTPRDTGHLMESIHKVPVSAGVGSSFGGGLSVAYMSGCETDLEYAEYVERGTGLFGPYHMVYTIRPKNPDGWLRWINPLTGLPVFAKSVTHKGSEGAHMFANGAAATEADIDRIVAPALERWAVEQTRSNPWAVGI